MLRTASKQFLLHLTYIYIHIWTCILWHASCGDDGQEEAQVGQVEAQESQEEAQDGQEEAQDGQDEVQDGQEELPRGPR